MSSLVETVFVGRNNAVRLSLHEDKDLLMEAYPALVPSRWLLTIHTSTPIVFDSDTDPSDVFNWDSEVSVLEINIGPELSPSTATSRTLTTLTMFSDEFPDGVVFVHPTCTKDKLYLTICNRG